MAAALKAGPGAGFMEWAYLVFSRLNSRYEQGTAESVLSWAIETFGTGLAVGTSFGTSGLVLMDLAIKIQPDVDIIDTGYFFPETNKLIDRLQDHYQRNLRRVLPEQTIAQQAEEYGPALDHRDPDFRRQLRQGGSALDRAARQHRLGNGHPPLTRPAREQDARHHLE